MRRKRVFVFLLGGLLVAGLVSIPILRRSTVTAQVKVDPSLGPKLILFWEPDFQGPSLEITGTVADMPVIIDANGAEFNWNDNVRSLIVVGGTWRLHQNGRLNTKLDDTPLEILDLRTKETTEGWSCLVSASSTGPLQIANPAAGGFSNDISSVELVSEKNMPDWLLPTR